MAIVSTPNYANREIDAKFANAAQLSTIQHEQQMEVLGRIEGQTIMTNGRVTRLEASQIKHEKEAAVWKGQTRMAIGILIFLIGSVLVPLTVGYIFHH